MSFTTKEVVNRYSSRKINRTTGGIDWNGSSIHSNGDNLYSFGSRFMLAKYLGMKGESPLFLKNGDNGRRFTSRHQRVVQGKCEGPTVSFTALRAAGIYATSLTLDNIVDFVADSTSYTIHRDRNTGRYYGPEMQPDWKVPKVGMFIPYGGQNDAQLVRGYWHILGATLLKVDEAHYLCSLDEGRYFVSQLRRPAASVQSAFAQLRPRAVRVAERAGIEVGRQGEWFFIPTGLSPAEFAKAHRLSKMSLLKQARFASLPKRDRRSNDHVVRHIKLSRRLWAFGTVRHRDNWTGQASGEHAPIVLGDIVHSVYKNTERASWSMGGSFD